MATPDAAIERNPTMPSMSTANTATLYSLGEENYTAFEVKELLIEYSMRSWQGNMMMHSFTGAEFGGMASFDPEELEAVESGAPLYTGTDLHSALEHDTRGYKRCRYLSQIFTSRNDQDLIDNVLRLLDVDLTQVRAFHLLGKRANMTQKAIHVANHRVKCAVIPQVSNTLSEKMRPKQDFKVYLRTLHGGNPGHPQTVMLYFDFSTPFALFLSQLQDSTQLSVIPPLDINESYRTSSRTDQTRSNSMRHEDTKDNQQNALGIMFRTLPETFTTPSDSAASDPPKRRDPDPGYTLADGPWLYRVYVDFKVVSGYLDEGKAVFDRKITDQHSYKDMLDHIKAAGERPGAQGKFPIVGITHSMDHAAIEKWKHHMEEEAYAHERFQQDLIAYDGYQEANTGEPFIDYWSSSIADEKNKASRENYQWEINLQRKGKNQKEINAAKEMYLNGRFSPKFGKTAFDAWMKDKVFEMREEVEKMMKPIDEQMEFQRNLDTLWDKVWL